MLRQVGAKLCRTPALQDQVWWPLAYTIRTAAIFLRQQREKYSSFQLYVHFLWRSQWGDSNCNDKMITIWAWVIIASKILKCLALKATVCVLTLSYFFMFGRWRHSLFESVHDTEVTIKTWFWYSTLWRYSVKYILFCHSVKTNLKLHLILW